MATEKVKNAQSDEMEAGNSVGEFALLSVDTVSQRVVAQTTSLVGVLYKSVAEKLFEEFPEDKAVFEEVVFTNELSLTTIEIELIENLKGILGTVPPPAFTAFVLHAFEQKIFKNGEVIVKEGDRAETLYMIIHGGADVTV